MKECTTIVSIDWHRTIEVVDCSTDATANIKVTPETSKQLVMTGDEGDCALLRNHVPNDDRHPTEYLIYHISGDKLEKGLPESSNWQFDANTGELTLNKRALLPTAPLYCDALSGYWSWQQYADALFRAIHKPVLGFVIAEQPDEACVIIAKALGLLILERRQHETLVSAIDKSWAPLTVLLSAETFSPLKSLLEERGAVKRMGHEIGTAVKHAAQLISSADPTRWPMPTKQLEFKFPQN